jgi:superfamily I DNA/RNA helicase
VPAPGPPELGRAVLVGAGQPAPAAWASAERVVVDAAAVEDPAAVVGRLHQAWADRQPVVIELGVDPAPFRAPAAHHEEPWRLGPGFEVWGDRLHFLVWANSYDARAEGEPIWWWARKAGRLGADPAPADGVGDVVLPDGTPAWIDGGPRSPLAVPLAGAAVVHRDTVELGRLTPQPPPGAPTAELAADQLASVGHGAGPARIVAPAGSGKTRVLTERLRHLLADRGYERDAVLALAYNKKAQEEMASRLTGTGARIQTLNAWGYGLLARDLGRRPDLLDERAVRGIVEQLVPTQRRRVNTDPIAPYLDGLSLIRLGLRDPEEVEATLEDVPGLAAAYGPYRAELQRRGAIDFDEQVFGALEALVRDGALRRAVQADHRHLLVDELQDLTPAHVLLVRLAAAPAFDVFAVGDDDQCQPPGTMVTTGSGQVPIEQLDPARHELRSWDRVSCALIGGTGSPHANPRRSHRFGVAGRQYDGDLITIHAGDAMTRVTTDHLCLARFTDEAWASGPKAVYLMRRGDRWRIGKCSLRHGSTFGPALRMRAERADAVWVLDVYADAREALTIEALTAANFGLPMSTFEPVMSGGPRADGRSAADIAALFDRVEGAGEKAARVLAAFGRDPRYPFWSRNATRGGRVTMLLRASNLVSDWMAVPVPRGSKSVDWVPAKLDRSPYKGPVYSLSVDPLQTYIADGIVVHNCIYGHAGADPRFLIDYDRFFPGAGHHALEVNYRCPAAVTQAAATLLSYNDRRVPKDIRPGPGAAAEDTALVVRTHAGDAGAAALVGAVSGWLDDGAAPAEVAVLTRVHSLLLAPHVALAEAGVPVDSILDEGVLSRLGLRAALAYLRIALDPDHVDGRDLSEVHRRPSRGLPQWATKFLDRCRSIRDVRQAATRIDDARVAEKLDDLAADLDRLAQLARGGATARDLLTAVRDDIGLGTAMTLLDSSGGASASHLDDLEALLQVADLHPDAATFEAWLRRAFHRERAEGGVVLSTVHRVKGLEWDHVAVFGVTEGIVPHRLSDDVEEERRVLHVAITRGRRRVVVLGDRGRPSPFLGELDGTAPRGVVHAPSRPAATAAATARAKRKADPITSVPAVVGLALSVLGGYSGEVVEVDDEGVRLAVEGGGTFAVRFGERVQVDGAIRTLGPPPSPLAEAASAALRAWRAERSRADKVPAYVVLNDKHLDGIAERRPEDLVALRACPGIGPAKLDAYGEEILALLAGLEGG